MKRASLLLTILMLLGATGCKSFETRSYEISVENRSSKPVSVWLTKNGPVFEGGWKSPEEWAVERPTAEPFGFQQIPPGKTADTGKVTGSFAPQTQAILRIYVGQNDFNQILSINRGDPDRIELILRTGKNDIVLVDSGGRVIAARREEMPPAAQRPSGG